MVGIFNKILMMKKAPWEHVAGTAAIAMHQDPTWQAQEIADGRGNANNL